MVHRTRIRMAWLVGFWVLVSTATGPAESARQSPNPALQIIERVIRDFLTAFSNRDFAAFVPYFTEDATVFFPPSAAAPLGRIQGRTEIEKTFKAVFDAYPPRPARAATPIAPQDLLIQEFEGQAVVTFQLGNEGARQRRTFVLRRLKGEWKIVHLHGSAAGGPS